MGFNMKWFASMCPRSNRATGRVLQTTLLFALLFATPSFAQMPPSEAKGDNKLYIQLKDAKLRAKPQQFAKSVADLHFGDRVDLVARDGAWLQVSTVTSTTTEKVAGYLHEGAVTPRKIFLSAPGVSALNAGVDLSDVYLAGKGFSAGNEQDYAKVSPESNFMAVDTMSSTARSAEDGLDTFIQTGGLKGQQ